MKTQILSIGNSMSLLIMLVSTAILLNSCSGFRKITKEKVGKEITNKLPCSEFELDDSQHFRSSSNATAFELQTAKDEARFNCESSLAGKVESFIASVEAKYESNTGYNGNSETRKLFQGLTYRIIRQKIKGVESTCYSVNVLKDGRYQVFLAMQLKNDLLEQINKSITDNEKLKTEVDMKQFEKIYNDKMNEYVKEKQAVKNSIEIDNNQLKSNIESD